MVFLSELSSVGGGHAGWRARSILRASTRRFVVVDGGSLRAAWIPASHNIPFCANGISGAEILARQRGHAQQNGARVIDGDVASLQRSQNCFRGVVELKNALLTVISVTLSNSDPTRATAFAAYFSDRAAWRRRVPVWG